MKAVVPVGPASLGLLGSETGSPSSPTPRWPSRLSGFAGEPAPGPACSRRSMKQKRNSAEPRSTRMGGGDGHWEPWRTAMPPMCLLNGTGPCAQREAARR